MYHPLPIIPYLLCEIYARYLKLSHYVKIHRSVGVRDSCGLPPPCPQHASLPTQRRAHATNSSKTETPKVTQPTPVNSETVACQPLREHNSKTPKGLQRRHCIIDIMAGMAGPGGGYIYLFLIRCPLTLA